MMHDIKTVMWKEWREYLSGSGSKRRGNLGVILFALVAGVILPASNKRADFVHSALPIILYAAYLPIFVIINVVADAFAGERERHTLETLLASRLPDRAILFGKVASAVSYGWGLGLAAAVLGLATANFTHGSGTLQLYSSGTVAAIVLLGLLDATLMASIGCLLSLRASSVRQVQQMLGVGVMCVVVIPLIVINILTAKQRADLLTRLSQLSGAQIELGIGVILLVIDAVLVAAAVSRFRRSRLILS